MLRHRIVHEALKVPTGERDEADGITARGDHLLERLARLEDAGALANRIRNDNLKTAARSTRSGRRRSNWRDRSDGAGVSHSRVLEHVPRDGT